MDDHKAEIRAARDASGHAQDPTSAVLKHHRVDSVEIGVKLLSGGHLLHLALAGCVFNNVFRLAAERGITVSDCRIMVDGGFTDTTSTGIDYEIEISGSTGEKELETLARDADADSTIAAILRSVTDVKVDGIVTHPGGP
jgi:uncharacterized OsmC-like protein